MWVSPGLPGDDFIPCEHLRGKGTPNQIWAYFVRYLKIINTFVKNTINILKLSEKLKNVIFPNNFLSMIIDQYDILHLQKVK